jgi:hypothetical protein
MAQEIEIFKIDFGNTLISIQKLKAELKDTRKAFETANIGTESYKKLETGVKTLNTQIKSLNDATKENTNALGGINKSAKFAEGSYGQLKQRIDEQRKSLLNLEVGTEEFNATQQGLIKLQEQRIAIESKIPSLFQERIKGAIDESNSLKQLRIDLKAAQSAALNGDGEAAKRVAELKDKIDDLKDSTKSLQGSGVERLNTSMDLLTQGFQDFDADKVKTGFKGIGAAMSAIPLILIIEGIKALIDNFDEVAKFVKTATGSFSEAEKIVIDLTKAIEAETLVNSKLIAGYDREIKLLTAKGGQEKEIIALKKEKIKIEIKEAENTIKLQAAKAAEILLNDDLQDSILRVSVATIKKIGLDEQAKTIEKVLALQKKARIKEEVKAIEEANKAILDAKNELLIIDIESNKKQVEVNDEKNKKKLESDKEYYKTLQEEQARLADIDKESIKKNEALKLEIRRASLEAQKTLEQEFNDFVNKGLADEITNKLAAAELEVELNQADTNKKIELLTLEKDIALENEQLTANEKLLINEQYQNDVRALRTEAQQQELKAYESLGQSILAISNNVFETQLNNVEKGSQQEKDIKLKQFRTNKALQLGIAAIQGTQAVLAAFSSGAATPVIGAATGAVYAALAGVVAATNIAKIASTPEPQFYEGGYTGMGDPKGEAGVVHYDEYVVPSRIKNTGKGSYHINQLEQMRRGTGNIVSGISGMFDGGFAARSASREVQASNDINKILTETLLSMPAPVVRVTDINNVNESVRTSIKVSSL